MIHLYSKDYYNEISAQFKKNKIELILIIALGLIVNIGIFVARTFTIEWGDSDTIYKALSIFCMLVWVIGLYIYVSLPYKTIAKYFRQLRTIVSSEVKPQEGIFFGMADKPEVKNGTDYYEMLFYLGRDNKGHNNITRIFWDSQSILPDIEIGDKVTYTEVCRVMRSYIVTEKQTFDNDKVSKIRADIEKTTGLRTDGE